MHTKESLLNTRMHELRLGNAFNRYFFDSKLFKSEEVLTLQEFIDRNQYTYTKHESLVCLRTPRERAKMEFPGLTKTSISFQKLRTLLEDHGFNYHDWVLLLPLVLRNGERVPQFELLGKEGILDRRVYEVTRLKNWRRSYYDEVIMMAIPKLEPLVSQFLVRDILRFEYHQIDALFKKSTDKATIRIMLLKIQKSLVRYGFTPQDGSFMKWLFDPLDCEGNYYRHLTINKDLSPRDAYELIRLSKMADATLYRHST